MERFLNAMKGHAAAMDRSVGQARFAIVASYDPARATARVRLQPENVLTGWLPVLSPWVGAGWGLVATLAPGDQVLVLAQEGDADHGVIAGGAFSLSAPPPPVAAGELVLRHASGATLRLANDGTIRVVGDLHVDGDVYDRIGSLDRLRQHYNGHSHGGPGSPTSAPD
ncbi:MAG: phage baseplate assembly protein V [Alphaproteobacteria bacterium]|nr:phage baseplate assembly protein V [Alphaproteobacteria bacterium]